MFMQPSEVSGQSDFCLPAKAEGLDHIKPDNKPKPSQDDQKHCYEIHDEICLIGEQTVWTKDIDPRIAKGRYCCKNRLPQAFQKAVLGDEDKTV